jgi:hypothetical protein
VPFSGPQIRIPPLPPHAPPSSLPSRSLVPSRKGVFRSYACSNWSNVSHRIFLFLGVFVQHSETNLSNRNVISLSESLVASMKDLHTAVTRAAQSNIGDALPSSGAVKAWAHHLSFGHWLGVPGMHLGFLNLLVSHLSFFSSHFRVRVRPANRSHLVKKQR